MDIIYECAVKFVKVKKCQYHFVVSKNRKTREIQVGFIDSDFFHLAGLHYLKDISIPQARKDTLINIIEKKKITDELLEKSRFYNLPQSDQDVKSRIEELRFLEEYFDTNNYIKMFNIRNMKGSSSQIEAEYIIESRLPNSQKSVYIFLKRREQNPEVYCLVSFFKKNHITYSGDALYWMLKEKYSETGCVTLYQHKNYRKKTNFQHHQ